VAVLLVLLASWVIAGGGGVISRERVQVTSAVVADRAPVGWGHDLPVRLTIRNLSGHAQTLRFASTPDATRVALVGGPGSAGLVIPAHGVLTVGRSGRRILLIGPRTLRIGQRIPLTLDFPGTGRFVVQATVIR
jgi:hypothetical protein